LQPALEILDRYPARRFKAANFVPMVNELSRELAVAYGKRQLLSAASKLSWLIDRHHVVIYDSQVRQALGASPWDYEGYVDRWNACYADMEAHLVKAIESLGQCPRLRRAEWFRRRVLDIYLWHKGAPI
jgi:hypothetical protein